MREILKKYLISLHVTCIATGSNKHLVSASRYSLFWYNEFRQSVKTLGLKVQLVKQEIKHVGLEKLTKKEVGFMFLPFSGHLCYGE